MSEAALQPLLNDPRIWRPGRRAETARQPALGTGYPELDAALPDGGWPLGTVTEIFHEQPAIGELQLILPSLAALSRRRQWLALVAPPYIPYAPGLAHAGLDLSRVLLIHPRAHEEHLWAMEQALRSGTCGAVVGWPRQADRTALRRLQLAAETGESWAALFRPHKARHQASTAAIRIALQPEENATLGVDLLKCRGAQPRRLQLRPAQAAPPNPTEARNTTEARYPSPRTEGTAAAAESALREAPAGDQPRQAAPSPRRQPRRQDARSRTAAGQLPLPL
ncbi:translesion DNA synthesis-associated protein ImuA [Halorhodospira sp. 9622]|uniref:translesion DNA synthesis-associated protein ImuA n=1 Tax=Halorhodospira sp. 9622 TaxID=2899136 RepID=UPI001EE8D500|nr:translesion DNA synthesis-associated protein ImuA [Halorhodospira sp. 9622]